MRKRGSAESKIIPIFVTLKTQNAPMGENENLRIYRASAGSGKTFTLVSEYIALAIAAGTNVSAFAGILAITFTNKATGEMKMRVLNTLWNIWKNEGDNAGYVAKISEILGGRLDEDEIRKRCGVTLRCILNNYDFFDVKTIDSFFQSIVGDIAAMIGFNSNLEVFLNDEEAINDAVDRIVETAAAGTDKRISALLKDYIEKNLDENMSWDFRRALKRFGRNVCMENYMRNEEKINKVFGDAKAFGELYDSLVKEKKTAEAEIATLGDGLTIDYDMITRGGYLKSYVAKARSGNWDGMTSSVEKFLDGNYGKLKADISVVDEWRDQLEAFEKDVERLYSRKISAELTLKDLNEMRMLEAIDREVKRQSREENRILLAKSQELVDEQLRDADSISFVFERAGRKYRHIMLDEAQDTSHMQFDNLWKLISNLISSSGNRCVVVGDVKQSIYRWRGGDWNILYNLGNKYDPMGRNCLKDNYRSHTLVVDFNNEVFDNMRKQHGSDIMKIYSDVVQNPKSKHRCSGYVKVEKITNDKLAAENERLARLLDNISAAHEAGVDYSDMAILTRTNKEIFAIADYVKQTNAPFRLNTREAYSLCNSVAVKMVVAALKFVWGEVSSNPDNVSGYFVARNLEENRKGRAFEEPTFGENGKTSVREYIERHLPDGLVSRAKRIAELPIAEAVMRVMKTLEIQTMKDESQYIFTFVDYINNYVQRNAYDFKKFFDDWEAESPRQFIASGTDDGIKAMTIHKAKGLEFHTVFVPYCDWKFVPTNDNKIWCDPHGGIYDSIPLVPIASGKKALRSIYKEDCEKEQLETAVDNMNTLYVAFTRAKANLMIEYVEPNNNKKTLEKTPISEWLEYALQGMDTEKYGYDIVASQKHDGKPKGDKFSLKGNVVELEINMEK